MKARISYQSGSSSTPICIAVVTFALVVIITLFLPATTHCGPRRERIVCVNNLKQAGLAARLWAIDHDKEFPWVSTHVTGSRAFANSRYVFQHYIAMSNELVSPKILICPTDRNRTKSDDFTKFSNDNLSYFVGLDADESKPQRLLSGDRNIIGGVLSNRFLRILTPTNESGWSPELHNRAGNVGLADGSVQQVTDRSLQRQLEASELPLIRLAIP